MKSLIIVPLLPLICVASVALDNLKAFSEDKPRPSINDIIKPKIKIVKKKTKIINMPLSYTPELMTTLSVVNHNHTYSVILRHQILNSTFDILSGYFGKNNLLKDTLKFNPVISLGIRSFLKEKPFIYFDFMQSVNIVNAYSVGVKVVIENPFEKQRNYVSSFISYTKVLNKSLVSLYIAYSSPALEINTKDLGEMFNIAKKELFKSSNIVLGLFFEKDITKLNPIGLSVETNLIDNVSLSIHYKI